MWKSWYIDYSWMPSCLHLITQPLPRTKGHPTQDWLPEEIKWGGGAEPRPLDSSNKHCFNKSGRVSGLGKTNWYVARCQMPTRRQAINTYQADLSVADSTSQESYYGKLISRYNQSDLVIKKGGGQAVS